MLEKKKIPKAAKTLLTDSYIDDIFGGGETLEEIISLKNDLIRLLNLGGFELRKWSSNDPRILADLPCMHLSNNSLTFENEQGSSTLKVLGLKWNAKDDYFFFNVVTLNKHCTKRNMLSELSRIYDPLGFLAPVSFLAKRLIQELWKQNLDWDQTPSEDVVRSWKRYTSELPLLREFRLPRQVVKLPFTSCEIHGFCDASESGYSAVIYFRIFDPTLSQSHIFFVCSKTKVAPLKRITIPRLELCAAVLLTKLFRYVVKSYEDKMSFSNSFAWSDSQVALSWIKGGAHKWKVFVSNRVAFIQEILPAPCWRYVESQSNPADIATDRKSVV